MIPDFHTPVGGAGDEDVGMEAIPHHLVDSHVVRLVRLQELAAVSFAAFVDVALLCTNQEEVVRVLVEIERGTTA